VTLAQPFVSSNPIITRLKVEAVVLIDLPTSTELLEPGLGETKDIHIPGNEVHMKK
jgi:hypothetical protein